MKRIFPCSGRPERFGDYIPFGENGIYQVFIEDQLRLSKLDEYCLVNIYIIVVWIHINLHDSCLDCDLI